MPTQEIEVTVETKPEAEIPAPGMAAEGAVEGMAGEGMGATPVDPVPASTGTQESPSAQSEGENPTPPPPVPPAPDMAALTQERDTLLSQVGALNTELAGVKEKLAACEAQCVALQDSLLNYEVGAALVESQLPPDAASLVLALYRADKVKDPYTPPIREWLPLVLVTKTHPASVLARLKEQKDPSATPGVGLSAANLRPYPMPR